MSYVFHKFTAVRKKEFLKLVPYIKRCDKDFISSIVSPAKFRYQSKGIRQQLIMQHPI